jgi:hypothetical protein
VEPAVEDGSAGLSSTEMFAAEEVIAHMQIRQPAVEIIELRVPGNEQVLSSSGHLKCPPLSNGMV